MPRRQAGRGRLHAWRTWFLAPTTALAPSGPRTASRPTCIRWDSDLVDALSVWHSQYEEEKLPLEGEVEGTWIVRAKNSCAARETPWGLTSGSASRNRGGKTHRTRASVRWSHEVDRGAVATGCEFGIAGDKGAAREGLGEDEEAGVVGGELVT